MKGVALRNYSTTETGYDIFLGNGYRGRFTSKREAKKFLADTNRFLCDILIELNDLYKIAFVSYRDAWFIFINQKSGRRSSHRDIETRIKNNLDYVEDLFNRIIWGLDDNSFSFIHTNKAAWFLSEAVGGLIQINKIRNNTIAYRSQMILKNRIQSLIEKLNSYPENKEAPVETGADNQN